MTKKILLLIIIAMLSFSSCALNLNSIETTTEITTAFDNTFKPNELVTDELKKLDNINCFIESIEKLPDYQEAMLYDFDFDCFPEVLIINYGMTDLDCEVYKFKDYQLIPYGAMIIDDNYPIEDSMYIDLYLDKGLNEYFYCSYPIDFVKNNSDEQIYGYYYGALYKYNFVDDKIRTTIISSFEDNYESEEQLQKYIQENKSCLSPYKKIKSIPIISSWISNDIKDGTYKEIVRETLKINIIKSST